MSVHVFGFTFTLCWVSWSAAALSELLRLGLWAEASWEAPLIGVYGLSPQSSAPVPFPSKSSTGFQKISFIEVDHHQTRHPIQAESKWCLLFSRISATVATALISEHFPLPPKKPQAHQQSLCGPCQPPTRSLLPWICLFWAFNVSGIMKSVVFCIWLLSLGSMFSRFVQDAEVVTVTAPMAT